MSSVDIFDAKGAKTGTAELPAELFDVTANIPLIHQVVVAQLAAARQGTHSTKTRADVRGGGRKPHRQKGTGRARQGSTRAPHFAGGGVAHGPHPHGYAQRTPKKMIAAALRGALSDRARDGKVHVIDDLVVGDYPSTKTALAALAAVSTSDKVLVVIQRDEDLAWLSLRNAVAVHAIAADQLNAYDVLVNDEVVFTATALAAYVAGPASGKSAKAVASSAELVFDEPTNAELGLETSTVEPGFAEPSLAETSTLAPSVVELVDAEPADVEPTEAEPTSELAAPVEESVETSTVEVVDLEPSTVETTRVERSVVEPTVVEVVDVEPADVEPTEAEPTSELAATSVEESAEPSTEDLAASADVASDITEPVDANEEDAR